MTFGGGKRQKKEMISLQSKCFILWGYLSKEVMRLKQQVESLGGEIVSVNRVQDVQYIYVTEFWFDQMIQENKWLHPTDHFFFQPPHTIELNNSPLPQKYKKISYPIEYLVENEEESKKRVLMPSSPIAFWEKQVPMWPYITRFLVFLTSQAKNQEDIMLFFQWITGNSLNRLECLSKAVSEMSVMLTNTLDLLEMFQIMAQVASELPFLFPIPPPLLFAVEEESTKNDCLFHATSVHLTKCQAFALLVHAFFTTFPDQSDHTGKEFPFFDMGSLFGSTTRKDLPWSKAVLVQKLVTILVYFEYMSNILKEIKQNDGLEEKKEILTYTRISMELSLLSTQNVVLVDQMTNILDKYFELANIMSPFMIESNVDGGGKLIEDCTDCLQVDFANAFAGGGIFGRGCVQEEIRFLLSPELMISCLLMEKLQDHEAFLMQGSQRFTKYTGYGSSYCYAGRYEDNTLSEQIQVDNVGGQLLSKRRLSAVVGIDAINYSSRHGSSGNTSTTTIQYQPPHIQRELVKAITGFYLPKYKTREGVGIENNKIATGNWGCGVFGGDPELKFFIQWVAASIHQKQLVYVVFEDTKKSNSFTNQLIGLQQLLQQKSHLFTIQKVLEFLLIHLQEQHLDGQPPSLKTRRNNTSIPIPVSNSVLQLAISFFNS